MTKYYKYIPKLNITISNTGNCSCGSKCEKVVYIYNMFTCCKECINPEKIYHMTDILVYTTDETITTGIGWEKRWFFNICEILREDTNECKLCKYRFECLTR